MYVGNICYVQYCLFNLTKTLDSVHILLYRYETAMRTLQEVIAAMQTGSWEDAHVLYATAKATWQEMKVSCDLRFEKENQSFI